MHTLIYRSLFSESFAVLIVTLVATVPIPVLADDHDGSRRREPELKTVHPVEYAPIELALNPLSGVLYVTTRDDQFNGQVTAMDAGTGEILAEIKVDSVSPFHSILNIAVNPVTNLTYVSSHDWRIVDEGQITVIDGRTLSVMTTLPLGTRPFRLVVNPLTNRIYVSSLGPMYPAEVFVIDGDTHQIVASIPIGSLPRGIALDPFGERLYVTQPRSLVVIDTRTNELLQSFDLGIPSQEDIEYDPIKNLLYLVSGGGTFNRVFVIDPESGFSQESMYVGSDPVRIAVNPLNDRMYVTNADSDDVAIIDSSSFEIVKRISLCCAPYGVQTDLARDRIFVAGLLTDQVFSIQGFHPPGRFDLTDVISGPSIDGESIPDRDLQLQDGVVLPAVNGSRDGIQDLENLIALIDYVQSSRGTQFTEIQADDLVVRLKIRVLGLLSGRDVRPNSQAGIVRRDSARDHGVAEADIDLH